MNILVLGATGMLGSMVYDYLKNYSKFNVVGTSRKQHKDLIYFDVYKGFTDFEIDLEEIDFVINCIGITKPYCHDNNMSEVKNAIYINSFFPYMLAELAEKKGFKVIQVATNCVYSGTRGKYAEDVPHDPIDMYGKTKSLGEVKSKYFLNIRCSIIGPERFNKVFLLEWFLKQPKRATVNGFSRHLWNGVTTLQFAKLCKEIIAKEKFDTLISKSNIHHFVPSDSVNKYELLGLFNRILDKGLIINDYRATKAIDLTLTTKYDTISSFFTNCTIEEQIKELKKYMDDTGFYEPEKYIFIKNHDNKIGRFMHRSTCRFCQRTNLERILDFGNVPLAGGFLKKEGFSNEKFYPLVLNFCRDCFLIQISNVVPPEILFKNYFYFSSSIKTLVDHFADFAYGVQERFLKDVNKPAVFELGCNDGVLLKPFAKMGVKAIGVDPAENVVKSIDSKDITVINDFFTEKLALKVKDKYGPFDVFLSSYSFAHIDNMVDIMKGVKHLLKDDGVFIFEVYYLGTLIDEMQYDMIYHEHLSYYSLKTLSIFLKRFGMEIFDVKFIPGVRSGAVRFYAKNIGRRTEKISHTVADMVEYEKKKSFDKVETFVGYAQKVNALKEELLNLLNKLKGEGKTIIGYGASGRGTAIMNYCGIDNRYLDYVVDDAPAKHNFYTPGTHLPIKSWDFVKGSKFPDYVLLFAWSFIDEVKKRRKEYLEQGGRFIIPLPKVEVISK